MISRVLSKDAGGVRHDDPSFARRGQVDVIESHAKVSQQPDAPALRSVKGRTRQVVGERAEDDVGVAHGATQFLRAELMVVCVQRGAVSGREFRLDRFGERPRDDDSRFGLTGLGHERWADCPKATRPES